MFIRWSIQAINELKGTVASILKTWLIDCGTKSCLSSIHELSIEYFWLTGTSVVKRLVLIHSGHYWK